MKKEIRVESPYTKGEILNIRNFRNMSLDELDHVLDYQVNHDVFDSLLTLMNIKNPKKGDYSRSLAKALRRKWRKEH